MRFDSLAEPIPGDLPCGPDLEETGDGQYGNFLLRAGGLFPDRFDPLFNKNSIDLPAEIGTIAGYLRRTHDLRLLTLDARFHAVMGKIVEFCEAAQGIGTLVSGFWDDVHPQPFDGDFVMRLNALESLNDLGQIVLPLRQATIAGGRGRGKEVTYRRYQVARQEVPPREGEEVLVLREITATLADDLNKTEVLAVHDAARGAIAALEQVREIFVEKAGHEQAPNFDRLTETLGWIADLIAANRPELAAQLPVEAEGEDAGGGSGQSASPTRESPVAGVPVGSHAAASAALLAAETYFLEREPSSPALILVHQARRLIGRPLVEALEALLPEPAARAALSFENGNRFHLDLTRMQTVTSGMFADRPPGFEPGPGAGSEPIPDYSAATRGETAALIAGTEAFFAQAEPSSPIPLLLSRARFYLSKDFLTILRELLPEDTFSG